MLISLSHRYRAVASWSRVQGVGIPLFTVIEIVSIWLLSFFLAVPEAMVFDMHTFVYRNQTLHTCMMKPTTDFLTVRLTSSLRQLFYMSHCFSCLQTMMCCTVHCVQVHSR